jgi:hypothetical protein
VEFRRRKRTAAEGERNSDKKWSWLPELLRDARASRINDFLVLTAFSTPEILVNHELLEVRKIPTK